jgi:membrane fusion protein (multidrug efflux system)
VGGATGCDAGDDDARGRAEPPPTRVEFVTADARTVHRTISTVGALESPNTTTVASEVRGRVLELDVPEGRRVEAGHVLARLDDAEARAAVRVTAARLTNARDRLRRLENLRAESVSSEQAYDDARSEFDAASGAFEEATTRLEKTTIRAPFTGIAGLRQVDTGRFVDAGTPIVELTQVDPLDLAFGIPQRFASELALGQRVAGAVGRCGPAFEGVVEVIDPRVDPATRSIRLQARVPNPDGDLYPGMAVSLRLQVGEIEEAVVVPQEAVVRQGTRHLIYVLDPDDRAEQRVVALGQFFEDGVHVVSGVEPGERVVAAGQQKLRPGAPTAPAPFAPTRNPNLELGRRLEVGCEEGG